MNGTVGHTRGQTHIDADAITIYSGTMTISRYAFLPHIHFIIFTIALTIIVIIIKIIITNYYCLLGMSSACVCALCFATVAVYCGVLRQCLWAFFIWSPMCVPSTKHLAALRPHIDHLRYVALFGLGCHQPFLISRASRAPSCVPRVLLSFNLIDISFVWSLCVRPTVPSTFATCELCWNLDACVSKAKPSLCMGYGHEYHRQNKLALPMVRIWKMCFWCVWMFRWCAWKLGAYTSDASVRRILAGTFGVDSEWRWKSEEGQKKHTQKELCAKCECVSDA